MSNDSASKTGGIEERDGIPGRICWCCDQWKPLSASWRGLQCRSCKRKKDRKTARHKRLLEQGWADARAARARVEKRHQPRLPAKRLLDVAGALLWWRRSTRLRCKRGQHWIERARFRSTRKKPRARALC